MTRINGRLVIDGQRQYFSPFVSSENSDAVNASSFAMKSYRTRGAPGELLVTTFKRRGPNEWLWAATRHFPDYFSQYDIYADENSLIMPNSERFNYLTRNGFKIRDLLSKEQAYSHADFRKAVLDGYFLMATKGHYLSHDRRAEHFVGALVMPKILIEKFARYVAFEEYLLLSDLKMTKKMMHYEGAGSNSYESGSLWDRMTTAFGANLVEVLVRRPEEHKNHILYFADLIIRYDKRIATGMQSKLAEIALSGHYSQEYRLLAPNFLSLVKGYDEKFLPPKEMDNQTAIKAAIQMVHEVTGRSLAELNAFFPSQ